MQGIYVILTKTIISKCSACFNLNGVQIKEIAQNQDRKGRPFLPLPFNTVFEVLARENKIRQEERGQLNRKERSQSIFISK